VKKILIFVVAALALSFAAIQPSFAQEKGAVRPGFSAENLRGQRILLMRPTVWVGAQSTGGMREPNADWTSQARSLLIAEVARRQEEFSNELIPEPELVGDNARMFAEYRALFNTVANSVMEYQFFKGNRLPTRKNKPFEWTLGADIKRIGDITGTRYALFINIDDQYGSLGRKLFQIFAAGIAGVGVKSGAHIGYAGLVDLETGDLVWLNADGEMGGDVRNAEGMTKRVGQLLEDFPGLKPVSAVK
jgi:hypothetical protein